MALTEGVKFDEGKSRFDLLDPQVLLELGDVAKYGANKYADRNWELGMDWGRVYAAAGRHLLRYWAGETVDPETGYHHTTHAMWCCMVLTAYQQHRKGKDTRPWQEQEVSTSWGTWSSDTLTMTR